MIDRALVPPAVTTAGSVITVVGTFLPWLRSGAVDRSSYEIFELVERLGFSPNGVIAWALRLWPLVPLLLVSAAISHWLRPASPRLRRGSAVLPLLTALVVGGISLAVVFAPEAALFRIGVGPWVSLWGAIVMVIGVCCARIPTSTAADSD